MADALASLKALVLSEAKQQQADLRNGGFLYANQQMQARAAANRFPNAVQGPRLESATTKAKPLSRDQQIGLAVNRALQTDQPLGQAVAQSRAAAPGAAVSGYHALSALVGPSIAALSPGVLNEFGQGPHATAGGVGLDAAMFLPIFRGPRAVLRAAKALRDADLAANASKAQVASSAARAARTSMGEAGPITQAVRGYKARTLTHEGLKAQLPKARSPITQAGERLVDKASTQLQGSKFVTDTPGLRLLTSGERVAKAAGRSQRIERGRAGAPLVEHVNAIHAVKEGSLEDQANFWYAQLPASHRNAEGLSLIRAKQADELAHITSGKALEDLTARETAIKAQMSAATDGKEALPFLKDLEEIKILKSDLPRRAEDTSASIGRLDKVIGRPGNADQLEQSVREAHANVQSLTSEAEKRKDEAHALSLVEPGTVRTEAYAAKEARIAQLERERFMYQSQAKEAKAALDQAEQAAHDAGGKVEDGTVRWPDAPAVNDRAIEAVHALGGVRQGILEASGRLASERAEPRKGLVARWLGLEPSGEEAYLGHRLPRPDTSGTSYMPSGGTGRVASPKGVGSENRLVLASTGRARQSLHVAIEDHASAQVFHQANVARDDLGRLGSPFTGHVPAGGVLVNPKGKTIPAHWKTDELSQFGEGYEETEHIREQAKEILDGFIATDRAGYERMKEQALEQGQSWDELRVVPKRLVDRYYAQFRSAGGRSTPTKVYDSLIDAVATSIVFARVGYIPKNFVQNLVMAVPHQGAFLLVNAVRAAQAMKDPELRHYLQAEVGHTGATGSLGAEAFTQKVLGKLAGGAGKIADDPVRFAAFLHEAAAEGVISKVRPLLNEKDKKALVRLFTDEAQRPLLNDIRSRAVEAMADFSRMTPAQAKLARRFLIIPGWLMAGTRYPFHFAATHPIRSALLAYIAMGEPGAPKELHFNKPLNEYVTGQGYKQGIETPLGRLRINSLSPVSTPYDLAQGVIGTVRGTQGPFDYQTPTVWDSVQPLAGAAVSIAKGEGVEKSLTRLAPNYQFISGMIHPAASPSYPQDATRLGRLERELGVVPIKVADSSAPYKIDKFKDKLLAGLQKVGEKEIPANVAAALDVRARRLTALDKSGERTPRGKFAVDVATLVEMGRMKPDEAQQALQWSKKAPARQLKSARAYLTSNYFDGKLLSATVAYLNKNAGTDLRLP